MSLPTITGQATEGTLYREAQSCLGPAYANSTYQFFLSGTSTPANVYEDGALTTPFPITGFVTADSYGRFPPIYLDTSVLYRVQFFDGTNTLRWTADPYASQLSTVGTSSLSAYGFTIAPTGEVTIPAPNAGGSGVTLTLRSGALGTAALQVTGTLGGNSAIIVNSSATTGTHTATFTATNKPGTAASAPAGWLPITCDGVQYYTPIWHGNPFTPYVSNPTAVGEVINASSVTFTGNGLTTATGGTAAPTNWFSPTATGVGAGYFINVTKTGGLSGVNFSAANGTWANITSGGLTISSNAQYPITGTYQLSTSVSGSPIVASGTIRIVNNNGVQSPTYNGATPLILAGNGTATSNGTSTSNWYSPTTANVGASYYLKITQTGGTAGCTFSAATSAPVNITNGGLSIGISGGTGSSYSVSGTYFISSDSAGTNLLGSGTITLNGSNVQSPAYSGTTPLKLLGNGTATLNGGAASNWYSPTTSNVGAGYWINITRTSGTSGVNFSAAQGSWTNITNSGLSIGMSGYTGDVGTVTVGGTYQISSSSSGTPVLGSGTISLSVNAGAVIHVYTSPTTNSTETIPTNTTTVKAEVWGSGGGGGYSGGLNRAGGAGGAGGFAYSSYAASALGGAGRTFKYTVTAGGAGSGTTNGVAGTAGSISSGTVTGFTTMTGGGGSGGAQGPNGANGAGGTATGGNTTNTAGGAGDTTGTSGSISGDGSPYGAGGVAGANIAPAGGNGGGGAVVFYYQ